MRPRDGRTLRQRAAAARRFAPRPGARRARRRPGFGTRRTVDGRPARDTAGAARRSGPPRGAPLRPGRGPTPTAAERRQTPDRRHADGAEAAPLLDLDERDRLTARLHHAVSGFVDGPGCAVEEADHVFEEAARLLTDALAQRSRALREPWRSAAAPTTAHGEPRLALRRYKEATERLLKV